MTTVAAIDCGTNTLKLLIGDLPAVAVRESRMVRLGQGVDRTGRLADEALERAFAALDEYAALIREHGAERIRFCATSATRDAANADDFTAGVRERIGVAPEVLSGADEAALAFAGAVRHLRGTPPGPVLVVDVGGGSTELVLGDPATGPTAAHSMDVGSVRLHERRMHTDPPTSAEVEACVADIEAALDEAGRVVDLASARTVLGIAGTVTTVAAGVLDLPAYDPDAIDQADIAVADALGFTDRLVAMTADERRALGYMHPGRADVIDAGALVLARVLRRAGTDRLLVSEADILDGIAWSLVDELPAPPGP